MENRFKRTLGKGVLFLFFMKMILIIVWYHTLWVSIWKKCRLEQKNHIDTRGKTHIVKMYVSNWPFAHESFIIGFAIDLLWAGVGLILATILNAVLIIRLMVFRDYFENGK